MSDHIKTGGSVFPEQAIKAADGSIQTVSSYFDLGGLQLRDYFATHASDEDIQAIADRERIKCLAMSMEQLTPVPPPANQWTTVAAILSRQIATNYTVIATPTGPTPAWTGRANVVHPGQPEPRAGPVATAA